MTDHQNPKAGMPKVLVTGFTSFPGAPVNPSEWLMAELEGLAHLFPDIVLHTAVLPVDYSQTIAALEGVCADFEPDIAIHFGLAGEAKAIRLEKLARNSISASKPDNAGNMPEFQLISNAMSDCESALPLAAIETALKQADLPVEWSDDAGGYLCNYLFFHSASGLCKPLANATSGFIHVPLTVESGGEGFTNIELLKVAHHIISTTVEHA